MAYVLTQLSDEWQLFSLSLGSISSTQDVLRLRRYEGLPSSDTAYRIWLRRRFWAELRSFLTFFFYTLRLFIAASANFIHKYHRICQYKHFCDSELVLVASRGIKSEKLYSVAIKSPNKQNKNIIMGVFITLLQMGHHCLHCIYGNLGNHCLADHEEHISVLQV